MPTPPSRPFTAALIACLAALALCAGAAAQPIAAQTSVERLLDDADADLRAMRLTSPAGNNAAERYRRVLQLDPRNARAAEGLAGVVREYVRLADDALARGRYDRAGEYLDRAGSVLPGNEMVAIARADLERARGSAARRLDLGTSAAPAVASSPAPATGQAARLASSPAPAPETPAAGRRLAIFPFETIVPCFVPVGKDVRTAAQRYVDTRPDAELVWSYYASGVDEREIPPPQRLWTANRARPEPRPEAVGAAARAVGADTVLMAWYYCSQSERITPDTYEVVVYVIDARTGRVRSRSDRLDFGPDVVRAILGEAWSRS